MDQTLSDTPAGLVAVIVAAKKAGDPVLEASARAELKRRFNIKLVFGTQKKLKAVK